MFVVRQLVLTSLLAAFAASLHADDAEKHKLRLPKVERDYAMIGAADKSGKTLAELIPPKTISRIALTHDHGIGDLEKRQPADVDALLVRLFESPAKAKQWGLSATERSAAEFIVVTKGGDLYRLNIVHDLLGNRPTACLLYAKGYTCRFAIDPSMPGNKKEK